MPSELRDVHLMCSNDLLTYINAEEEHQNHSFIHSLHAFRSVDQLGQL